MSVLRKPKWLKANKTGARNASYIHKILAKNNLNTVCDHAHCPNRGECYERKTATFMILGSECTRNCKFCAVDKDKKRILPPDPDEPRKIAEIANELKLKHIVITTVTRDDLEDGGASHFAETVRQIRLKCPGDVSIELLISDLQGNFDNLKTIMDCKPDVLNHNIETVPRLYPEVRPMAIYRRSLDILQKAKEMLPSAVTKSGIMVGLGEQEEEVIRVMRDLYDVGCRVMTIGQYMAPTKNHLDVVEYVHPDQFEAYRKKGEETGFWIVESAPLVRSSYRAEKIREFIQTSL
ncbi:MAG: lipoyl synthase [Candidatus Cloacimonadota bacterium]|nr:MAG: lipoyl synthase [Candidatus Cloacimonadota bacterium]